MILFIASRLFEIDVRCSSIGFPPPFSAKWSAGRYRCDMGELEKRQVANAKKKLGKFMSGFYVFMSARPIGNGLVEIAVMDAGRTLLEVQRFGSGDGKAEQAAYKRIERAVGKSLTVVWSRAEIELIEKANWAFFKQGISRPAEAYGYVSRAVGKSTQEGIEKALSIERHGGEGSAVSALVDLIEEALMYEEESSEQILPLF